MMFIRFEGNLRVDATQDPAEPTPKTAIFVENGAI
jgi:hypothetical protein